MSQYRITIEKIGPDGWPVTMTTIKMASIYTLENDIPEWAKTEIDPQADIAFHNEP